jgi:hypothetical protein
MKVVLVDCLIYRGLPRSRRRHAAPSPDRDLSATTRMKRAQSVPHGRTISDCGTAARLAMQMRPMAEVTDDHQVSIACVQYMPSQRAVKGLATHVNPPSGGWKGPEVVTQLLTTTAVSVSSSATTSHCHNAPELHTADQVGPLQTKTPCMAQRAAASRWPSRAESAWGKARLNHSARRYRHNHGQPADCLSVSKAAGQRPIAPKPRGLRQSWISTALTGLASTPVNASGNADSVMGRVVST